MKVRFFLGLLLLAFIVGCNGAAFTADRVKEINDQWYKMYQTDRRQTKVEIEEWAELTDEQKLEWRRAGGPSDRPLSDRTLDAARDFLKAINLEVEAAKK